MIRIPCVLPLVVATVLFLGGCATTAEPVVSHACVYKERDLTLPWSQRAYWCVPHQQLAARPNRVSNE